MALGSIAGRATCFFTAWFRRRPPSRPTAPSAVDGNSPVQAHSSARSPRSVFGCRTVSGRAEEPGTTPIHLPMRSPTVRSPRFSVPAPREANVVKKMGTAKAHKEQRKTLPSHVRRTKPRHPPSLACHRICHGQSPSIPGLRAACCHFSPASLLARIRTGSGGCGSRSTRHRPRPWTWGR